MLTVNKKLTKLILDLCDQNTDAPWEFGYNENDVNDIINRGRKILKTCETNIHEPVLEFEREILDKFVEGDTNIMRPCYKDRDPLTNFVNYVYTDQQGRNTMGVQKHTDPRDSDGWLHMRINFMLRKADMGGEPIIANRIIDVSEGECWNCWASEHIHSVFPVKSNKARIILSMGFFVSPDHVKFICNKTQNLIHKPCNFQLT